MTNLRRDTKLSLADHATEVKRLVSAAYTDLPQTGDGVKLVLQFIKPHLPTEASACYKPTVSWKQYKLEINISRIDGTLTQELLFGK